MKVLIVYYSTFGNVYKMAQLVAEGVRQVPGAEPVIRTVAELIPQDVIDSREDMKAGRAAQTDVPLVTLDDFRGSRSYRIRYSNEIRKCLSPIEEPDRSVVFSVGSRRTGGQTCWRVCLHREPARRAGNHNPYHDGTSAAFGDDFGGRAVFRI